MMASRSRAVTLLAAVFIAGLIVGIGVAFLGRGYMPPARRHHGPEDYVARLTHELDLSPTQRDSVGAILTRRRASMDSLWRDVGPRFETLQASVRSDIRAQLNPDQQRKFAEMTKRFDAMRGPGASHAPR
jgi:hypothetical protein